MSTLFTGGKGEIQCAGKVQPDPMRRTDACAYRAEYAVLPTQEPMCFDHRVDYMRSRALTAFDVLRAQCPECKAVQQGERELRREERRGRKGDAARAPRPRVRDERWCPEHDDEEFARWRVAQQTRGPR